MKVLRSIADYRRWYRKRGPVPPRIGYVPTMGALHAGHRSLIGVAKGAEVDLTVVSIFVNPLQFGPEEDYARYPRPVEADLAVCEAAAVDAVFMPSVADLYPAGRQVSVSAGPMGTVLEGRSRPGHFDGVLTVVLKLFNLVHPSVAVFGRKDAQQLACIQRLVTDLNLGVDIMGAPTVRDPDGLAISSRNAYLSAAERVLALNLSEALSRASSQTTVDGVLGAAHQVLDQAALDRSFVLDYAALVNPATFTEVPPDHSGPATLVLAAQVGGTRLLDNTVVVCEPDAG